LFVGNLPFDATEEGLRDMIEASAASSSSSGGPRGGNAKAEPESDSESENESEGEEEEKEDGEEKKKEEKQANRGGKLSGLRKVRLGAFEDTGRCKGLVFFTSLSANWKHETDYRFAFLDFLSPEQATAALLNRGNKYYTNRKLTLQVSSPEFPDESLLITSTLQRELPRDQEQDEH